MRLSPIITLVALLACGCTHGGGGGSAPAAASATTPASGGTTTTAPPTLAQLAAASNARRTAYLQQAVVGPFGVGEDVYTQVSRCATGTGPLFTPAIDWATAQMGQRQDTSDFSATALLRLLYGFGTSTLIAPTVTAEIQSALIGFKYWLDEPGQDPMVYWSENHQILFASAEYLAGNLFPRPSSRTPG